MLSQVKKAWKYLINFNFLKKDPLGTILIVKRFLISIIGAVTYSRYMMVNNTKIQGTEYLFDLPNQNVLFLSNHQTYYADVIAFYHIFCSVKWKFYNTIKYPVYLLAPRVNMYFVAAMETMMNSGWLPKVFAYTGAVTVERSWRSAGKSVKRKLDSSAQANIGKALQQGWVVSFPQGTTNPSAPVRKGSAHLIKEFNPIVVPVAINGFRRAFDKKGLFFKKRGTTLSIKFKAPVRFNPEDSPEEIVAQVTRLLEHDFDGFEAKEMK